MPFLLIGTLNSIKARNYISEIFIQRHAASTSDFYKVSGNDIKYNTWVWNNSMKYKLF